MQNSSILFVLITLVMTSSVDSCQIKFTCDNDVLTKTTLVCLEKETEIAPNIFPKSTDNNIPAPIPKCSALTSEVFLSFSHKLNTDKSKILMNIRQSVQEGEKAANEVLKQKVFKVDLVFDVINSLEVNIYTKNSKTLIGFQVGDEVNKLLARVYRSQMEKQNKINRNLI